MADIDLSVLISRTWLGLDALEIAQGGTYYLAPQFLGATVTWTRQQVTSPFVDGQITTSRMRPNVVESIGVEVVGSSAFWLQQRIKTLLDAFTQQSFTMTVRIDGAFYQYLCECADYQTLTWTTPRAVSLQGQVLFQMPRQPVPVAGGI
jgi:hypothetical protein